MAFWDYTNKSPEDIYKQLSTDSDNGLTQQTAQTLLKKFGTNSVKGKQITALDIFIRQFKSAFLYLLLAAGVISLFLGEMIDGFMIFGFVLINALLGFYQEFRSHQALKHLQNKYFNLKNSSY